MFNIGGGELLAILVIALIVLGPSRLPDAARTIGKTMSELRRLSTSFQNEVRTALDTADDPNKVASRRNVLSPEEATPTTEARPPRRKPLVAAPADDASPPSEPTPAKPTPAKATTEKTAKAAPKAEEPKNGTAVSKPPTGNPPTKRAKPS